MNRVTRVDCRRHVWLYAAGLLVFATTACDLKVASPDITQPVDLNNPTGATTRAAGAIATFATGFANQVLQTGLLTDEFSDRNGSNTIVDQRMVPATGTDPYPYAILAQAHSSALRAIVSLQQYSPTSKSTVAELFDYVGAVEVMFAENLCDGVPVGILRNGQPASGPTLTREAMLGEARAHFDSAQKYASSGDSAYDLASIGLGRAWIDADSASLASQAVSNVPTSFVFQEQYDPSGVAQSNAVFLYDNALQSLSVSNDEGGSGLDFVTAADPRVVTDSIGSSAVTGAPIYALAAYNGFGAPITLASGVEARLIEAEALLDNNDVNGWTAALNALRADAANTGVSGLQPLPDSSTTIATPTQRVATMFRERAFWLFATGHRQGDLRRMVRTYRQQVNAVFPSGTYQSTGQQYGSAVTFSPTEELVNPAYHGCTDRNP